MLPPKLWLFVKLRFDLVALLSKFERVRRQSILLKKLAGVLSRKTEEILHFAANVRHRDTNQAINQENLANIRE